MINIFFLFWRKQFKAFYWNFFPFKLSTLFSFFQLVLEVYDCTYTKPLLPIAFQTTVIKYVLLINCFLKQFKTFYLLLFLSVIVQFGFIKLIKFPLCWKKYFTKGKLKTTLFILIKLFRFSIKLHPKFYAEICFEQKLDF